MKIIKFSAIWCMECIVMKPVFEEISKEIKNIVIETFDADDNLEEMKQYNIKDIPTFIILDNDDKEIERLSGFQKKEKFLEIIKKISTNL